MNKTPIVAIILIGLCAVFGIIMLEHREHAQVTVYTGDQFTIPDSCKHIALIGCTPNPTNYLAEHGNNPDCLKGLRASDFLDAAYVQDSFERTFAICKELGVDHLVIAYLPIYFVRMRPVLGDQFVCFCRMFLTNITADMTSLIKKAAQQAGYAGQATLIIPMDYQLAHVPFEITGKDERIRYLIKQFPVLKNITQSALSTITIINNEQSAEDEMIIAYLKYEYLYDKPIQYLTRSTGKKLFHKGPVLNERGI